MPLMLMPELNRSFEPLAGRAEAMNLAMYAELAQSLRYLVDAAGDAVSCDRTAVASLCDRLERGHAHFPVLFARYYALVRAMLEEDSDAAERLFHELTAAPLQPDGGLFALGADLDRECSALYASLMEAGEPKPLGFAKPDAERVTQFRSDFAEAMALIDRVVPLLGKEIRALARQIVLVGQRLDVSARFDGGSHFQLWNALFLNIDRERSRIKLAEVIAHESAHSLLFGFCTHESLTLNDDDARFASPLREDARPMDGIYHATFVSARMYWLMMQLLDSDMLSADERVEAGRSAQLDRQNFEDGYAIVAAHGHLSETGNAVMAGARDYMTKALLHESLDLDRKVESAA